MKVSTTLFLVLLLTGLGVYSLVSEKSLKAGSAELNPIKILTLAEGDFLTRLVIENGVAKETVALKREEKGWMLKTPVSYPAENFLVEGMLSALTFSRRLRRFPGEEKEWQPFGLERPPIRIGIETEKTPGPRYLLLGKESPVGAAVYARWEGEKEYFLIAPEIKAAFERTAYSLRQKKLFRSEWDRLKGVDVKVDGKEFHLEKKEIPVEKVSDLIDSLESLYIKEFLDGRDSRAPEFGFQARNSFIVVRAETGTEERVLIGAAAEGKDACYAVREKEKIVFLISERNLKSFLENFELLFQELRNVDPRKSREASGKNPKGSREGGPESG